MVSRASCFDRAQHGPHSLRQAKSQCDPAGKRHRARPDAEIGEADGAGGRTPAGAR